MGVLGRDDVTTSRRGCSAPLAVFLTLAAGCLPGAHRVEGHHPVTDARASAASDASAPRSDDVRATVDGEPDPYDEMLAAYEATESNTAATVPRSETEFAVLMYHSIDTAPVERSVSPLRLKSQIAWLRSHGATFVRMADLRDFLEGTRELPRRAVLMTFDDGEAAFFRLAFPILAAEGVPFALALPTRAVSRSGRAKTLSWTDVRSIVASGLAEIGSHGHTHAWLTRLPSAKLVGELSRSAALIEEHVGTRPDALFYPFGAGSDLIAESAGKLGYRLAFTAWGRLGRSDTKPFFIPRFAMTRSARLTTLLPSWQHPPSLSPPSTPDAQEAR